MRLTTVLLRWYKSFNISYRSEDPPRIHAQPRPWDALDVGDKHARDYPFVEIPLESDITTVVGGNESGKSHLISAISKVLLGQGVHEESFSQTDFCRYATVPDHNPKRWPNIGVHFTLDAAEAKNLKDAVPAIPLSPDQIEQFTLILGSTEATNAAHIFLNRTGHAIPVSEKELEKVRLLLPRVQFIDAEAALPDNLTLSELLAATDPEHKTVVSRYTAAAAQRAAEFLAEFKLEDGPLSADMRVKIDTIRASLGVGRADLSADARLAASMFIDILDVPAAELKQVLDQPVGDRGYSEYFLKTWNDRIIERLDLAHFWQQDDQASIELIYKDKTLYFDITDKTGATYTFKERSSGLRYFLSYYIQAKALERKGRDRNAVILMDEPDSFLSIIAQRNLLAVFESLVGRERSKGTSQLIYTTHSPFLINRNFPRRLRVVVKEEAEEGTQYYGRGSARRFEPVRSALGIDSAQTLFMGATNLVLEGLSDQYLINEMVRALITPDTTHECLDLNAVVVVSADGAMNIEKVLAASQWGDEPIPATVVLVDGDATGKQVIADITGVAPNKKKLIEPTFCQLLTPALHESLDGIVVETIEDLIPRGLYFQAFRKYVQRWQPDVIDEHAQQLDAAIRTASAESAKGNVAAVHRVCDAMPGLTKDYDKLGVIEQAIAQVRESSPTAQSDDVKLFVERMKALFKQLNDLVASSQQQAARTSMSTNVKRLIREFTRVRENGCSILELKRHLQRLGRESRVLHGVGEKLSIVIEALERALLHVEQSGQRHLLGPEWLQWKAALDRIRRDPLEPSGVEQELQEIQKA